jgi:hypothetical protein
MMYNLKKIDYKIITLIYYNFRMYDIETENRFWSKILTGEIDECWEIVAMHLNQQGYGEFWPNGKLIRAHRFSYQLYHNRLIKDNMCIMHSCDNRKCVNPHHLSEGTIQDNNTDKKNKGRVYHPKGEKHHLSKLTTEKVLEIRAKYTKGGTTYKKLGEEYGVNLSTVRSIINRKSWTHI